MAAKLGKVEIYIKGSPSIKSFDAMSMLSSYHVTDKKRYISISASPIATKRDRGVAANAGLLSTKSHNLLITWPHKMKNVIDSFSRNLWLGVTCLTTKSRVPLTTPLREVT